MPIDTIKKKIYVFIRERSKEGRISLNNIRLYADHNHISRGEMGYALHLLRESGAVRFSSKYGWLAR